MNPDPAQTDSNGDSHLSRGILLLVLIAGLAAALLGLLQQLTAGRVAANEAAHAARLVTAVLPGIDHDNSPATDVLWLTEASLGTAGPVPVYRARAGGEVVAVVITVVSPDGYVGPIEVLVGLNTSGDVLAARVSRHRETPGLGDAIEVGKSDWIQQFAGAAADSRWRLRRTGGDFDRLTGATVTSRAVTAAIGAAARYYRDNRAQLHSRPASQAAADRP